MVVSLIFLVMVFAIAYVQSTHGFFSALIMTVLTLCCAAAAVGMHEYVAVHFIAPYWEPDYAYGLALGALFGIPLIICRLLFDQAIRRSPLLALWPDRLGAGFCGLITGLVVTGICAHAVQALPFGPSILGFARVDVPPKEKKDDAPDPKPPKSDAPERELLMTPDRFAVAAGSLLSAGIFSGDALLALDHPDLVRAVGWVNAVPPEITRFAEKGTTSVVRTAVVPFVFDFTPGDKRNNNKPDQWDVVQPKAGHEFRMIRLQTRESPKKKAKYPNTFTLRQIRLKGTDSGRIREYFPIAIQQEDAKETVNRHVRNKATRWGLWPVVDDVMTPREGNEGQIEVIFELPTGFQPTYLAFKRGSRIPVDFSAKGAPAEERPATSGETPADSSAHAETKPDDPPSRSRSGDEASSSRPRRGGRGQEDAAAGRGGARGVGTNAGQSFFGNDLRVELKSYQEENLATARGGRILSGKLVAFLAEQESGTKTPVKSFDVPSDKRLLHLSVTKLHARSGLGKALSQAAAVAQNYTVTDAKGNRYNLVGKYVLVDIDGKPVMEVQYFPEGVGSMGGLGPFRRVQNVHLEQDHELVLLFFVNPGATIVSFSSGSDATKSEDLSADNLVAPQ